MSRRKARTAVPSPMAVAELALASWETIARRSTMIADGTCSPAEYARMLAEKTAAVQSSALALLFGAGPDAALAPWRRRARANARRLRKRK